MFEKRGQYHSVDGDDHEENFQLPSRGSVMQSASVRYCFGFVFIMSLAVNVWLLVEQRTHLSTSGQLSSPYAGLEYDTLRPFQHSTEYSSSNETRRQELWDNINFDAGMIYISQEHADSMDLLPTQDFPWDPKLKIYLLNGHHNLHCLQSIQKSVVELSTGKNPPTYPLPHIMHCLDTLRDDVLCHADDTPRYTTTSANPESGMGQLRQCRDWNKLDAWAKQYSGCWRYIDAQHDQRSELERWRFCEKGSPWYEKVRTWTEEQGEELA